MNHSKYTTKKGGKERTPLRDPEELHDSTGTTREQRMAAATETMRRIRRQDFDRLEADINRQEDKVQWLTGQWFNETYNFIPNRNNPQLDNQVNIHPNARELFKTIFKRNLNTLIAMLERLLNEYAPPRETGYNPNSVNVVDTENDIRSYEEVLAGLDQSDQADQANCIGNECTISGGRKRKSKKTKTSKKTRTSKKTKKTKKTRRVKKTNTRSK